MQLTRVQRTLDVECIHGTYSW